MTRAPDSKQNSNSEELDSLFILIRRIEDFVLVLLDHFNGRKIHLKDIPAHKRIFIFFFTRAVKTFSAIRILSLEGYSQDIATLLRSLLENFISVRYVLCDSRVADLRATRFVEYKWVVLKRYISNTKENIKANPDSLSKEFLAKRDLILEKVAEFKKKHKITSDKALVTWSGRALRDMARMADPRLLEEYDSTFRLSSRFSHPGIIGDREYLNHRGDEMIFSSLPSQKGISVHLQIALRYLLNFLEIFNSLFELHFEQEIKNFKNDLENLDKTKFDETVSSPQPSPGLSPTKEDNPVLKFQLPDQPLR